VRRNPQVSRTLALRSTQTLHELHRAIQRAFAWDADHLYAFWLHATPKGAPDARVVGPWEHDPRDHITLPANHLPLGMPGFVPTHTFRYLFDYGDQHEFDVTIIRVSLFWNSRTDLNCESRSVECIRMRPLQFKCISKQHSVARRVKP
jgi:hypothetical protein